MNTRLFFYISIFFLSGCLNRSVLKDSEIDQYSNFYFKILRMEASNTHDPLKYPFLYDTLIISGDTLFQNKYVGEAVKFMEEHTEIKLSFDSLQSNYSLKEKITEDKINVWEQAFFKKKHKIKPKGLKKFKLPPEYQTVQ